MRRSTVVNLRRVKIAEFICKNHILFLLTFALVAGIVAGTATVVRLENIQSITKSLLVKFVDVREDKPFMYVLLNSFLSSLLYTVAVFVSGASMLGVVVVPFVVLVRGFAYGGLLSYLYMTYALKGIAFNAIIVIPPAIIFLIGLLFAAREAVGFSLKIARLSLPHSSPSSLYVDFKMYCGRFAFYCAIILISAITDAVLCCSFMGFFKL